MEDTVETFELVAEKPVHGGAVLATAPDERRVFLRGALPGERVVARVTSEHKKYLWADTVEVLEPSEDRVDGIWPEGMREGIGGIELAHAAMPAQRKWKADVLAEQIERIGGAELAQLLHEVASDGIEVEAAPSDRMSEAEGKSEGSRTRIQLVATRDGRLGMRKFRSKEIVPVDNVPIAVEPIRNVSKMFDKDNAANWRRKWKKGERISIEAPTGGQPVVVTSKGAFSFPDGKPADSVSLWEVSAAGRTHHFKVDAGGFWQAHRDAPALLVEAVLEAAAPRPGQTVLEFYAGAGLFTRFLADDVKPGGRVLSLEGSGKAVRNAHANLLTEVESDVVELYTGSVDAEAVQEMAKAAGDSVDAVVLDPPRKGVPEGVVSAIASTSASRVVLVSCDPAAAARDLGRFVEAGYRLAGLRAFDIFPHSHHFETVAELIR